MAGLNVLELLNAKAYTAIVKNWVAFGARQLPKAAKFGPFAFLGVAWLSYHAWTPGFKKALALPVLDE